MIKMGNFVNEISKNGIKSWKFVKIKFVKNKNLKNLKKKIN